jgi:hypothetical protein
LDTILEGKKADLVLLEWHGNERYYRWFPHRCVENHESSRIGILGTLYPWISY